MVAVDPALTYEIHLKGHLHEEWADWFDGFTIICLENGEMLLRGQVIDQSALHGVLEKIRILNLTLLSLHVKTIIRFENVTA